MEGFWLIMGVWSLRELYLCTFWGAGKALLCALLPQPVGLQTRWQLQVLFKRQVQKLAGSSVLQEPFLPHILLSWGRGSSPTVEQNLTLARDSSVALLQMLLWPGPSCLLWGSTLSRSRSGLSLTPVDLLFRTNARLLVAPSVVEMMLQPSLASSRAMVRAELMLCQSRERFLGVSNVGKELVSPKANSTPCSPLCQCL